MPKIIAPFIISLLILQITACGSDQQKEQNTVASEPSSELESTEASQTLIEQVKAAVGTEKSPRKEPSHMVLGTGSVQGVYFPIGGVICRLLNRHKSVHRLRCTLESTGGSIYNLRELREGNFDLVFAQSDWQYHAYHGTSTFKDDGPNPDLRAVFALEADPLALIVKQESDIQSFDDLAGRVVSFGYARSLQHRIINDYLAAKEWTDDNFKQVRRMNDTKQVGQICAGKVDAILLLASSLTDHLKDLNDDCELRLLPIEGEEVQKVIEVKPYYRTATILKGMHLNSLEDVMSFGLGATFVANEATSPKAIYHVVKEVVENFRDFKSLHPSLAALDKRELSHAGISIPLHPGAVRYYKESRLLKK
ncbi:MAG: TRAP transporter TAXI family solute receptor [Cryomorphaceae bacterium]|jgi:TRAP transporter TAXI family solute receptor